MIRLGVIVCVVFLTTSYSFVDADRLTSTSDGSTLLGIGDLDAKKQNVMFRECKQKNSEIYSLKRFMFEKYPKDCGPPEISAVNGINLDGTTKSTTTVGCATGQKCLQYIVAFPDRVDPIFTAVKKGDVIDVVVVKSEETKSPQAAKEVDISFQLKEKTGKVKHALEFQRIFVNRDFAAELAVKKGASDTR